MSVIRTVRPAVCLLFLCACAAPPEPVSLLDGNPIRPVEQPSGWMEHERNYNERTRALYPYDRTIPESRSR